jgi:hypothetical protein
MTFRKTLLVLLAVLTVSFVTFAVGQRTSGTVEAKGTDGGGDHSNTTKDPEQPDADMAGVHWAKGHGAKATAGSTKSSNLSYHGGPVMNANSTVVQSVYWGASAYASTSSADKGTGIDAFYTGIGASGYMKTNTEYTDAIGHVTDAVSFQGHFFDSAPLPSGAPSTSAVLQSVARAIVSPVSNGYYPVYVSTPRGSAGYCAWHSYGSVRGVVVQFAFFFNLDGDPGCDPQDGTTGHSQGLAALANVSGHELSEAVTDPHLNAWYDVRGAENSDKCAWTFGTAPVTFTANSTSWKIQGNWSNAAYNINKGYVRGCIDGNQIIP